MLTIFGRKNKTFSALALVLSVSVHINTAIARSHFPNLRTNATVGTDSSKYVINFDELSDSTRVTNQYPNISFERATAISSGFSLNEYDARPHSGKTVIFDDGGPITITFGSPITSCSAFLAYSHQVELVAYDDKGNVVIKAKSKLESNLQSTDNVQNGSMEPIGIRYNAGIKRVRIVGNDSGNSFALDDLTVEGLTLKSRLVLHDHGQSRELKEADKALSKIPGSAVSLWKSTDPGKQLRLIVGSADIEKIKLEQTSLEFLFDEATSFELGAARGIVKTVHLDRFLIPLSGKNVKTDGSNQFLTLFYGVTNYGAGPYIAAGPDVDVFFNILREANLLQK